LNKPFVWPVRVYYEDTDAGGVVYYANYLKFMERGRTELLRAMGHEQDELISSANIIFAVRAVKIDYLRPARFNQLLQIQTKIVNIKKASLEFSQEIYHDHEILVTGEVKIACLDATTFKPKAIPENLIRAVNP
jgi:acyl-CoA thioester hydrolase